MSFFPFKVFWSRSFIARDHAHKWRSNSARFVLVEARGPFNPSIITGSVYKISEITIDIYYIMHIHVEYSLFGLLLLLLLLLLAVVGRKLYRQRFPSNIHIYICIYLLTFKYTIPSLHWYFYIRRCAYNTIGHFTSRT